MNWDQIKGQWQQLSGHAKSKWAKLTDDDVDNVAGKRDVLIGKIQERYGMLKEEAEKQVDGWIASYGIKAQEPKPEEVSKEGPAS
jgi:uncharacterized protein YjbJ (UPF0337 family)